MSGGERTGLPASERACDIALCAYAGWTLVCHAVVFSGGGLRMLAWATAGGTALAALAAVVGALRRAARAEPAAVGASRGAPRERAAASTADPTELRVALAGLVGALAVSAFFQSTADAQARWTAAALYLGLALAWIVRARERRAIPPVRSAGWERALWALAAAGALLPLIVQRRSLDDAYYLNVASAALDDPGAPLLAVDTLHGIAGLPLMFPVYRVHSYELLAAVLSWVSGLSVIEAAHWLVPAVFGLLTVLAQARLMRLLLPDLWLHGLLAALAVLVFVGEGTEFWGNFAFVRLHQGKCAFLSVAVPLLIVQGARFAAAPGLRSGALLFAAQVAGVGMTSTAIWAAPALAALAMAGRIELSLRGLRTLALGLATSSYAIALGLAFRGVSESTVSEFAVPGQVEELFAQAALYMLGSGPVALASAFAALAAWSLCRDAAARRLLVVLPLGVLLLLWNPWIALFVATHLTSAPTYYRVLWLLPVPAMLGVILCAPLCLTPGRTGPVWLAARAGAAVALTAAFVYFAPGLHTFSPFNFARLELLGLKVPEEEYRAARELAARVPPRSRVLAPEPVALWVVTLPQHPYPLMVRELYLRVLSARLDPEERTLRLALSRYVEGRVRSVRAAELLDGAIARYQLAGVCLRRAALNADAIRGVLASHAFALDYQDERYEIWVR